MDWKDSLETENLIQIQIHAHLKKINAHDGVICHILVCETVVYNDKFQSFKFQNSIWKIPSTKFELQLFQWSILT